MGNYKDNSCCGDGGCVIDVVRTIAEHQDNVSNDHCDISCAKSIRDLVKPAANTGLDTVPFILYTKKGQPFKGIGAEVYSAGGTSKFSCVTSFIFRVSEVDEDSDCAVLELLQFDNDDSAGKSVCHQIDNQPVEDLERTKICITVDLSCFCAITCLPPVSIL